MKQILQNLGTGETLLAEVPCPRRSSGSILVETTRSLVSLGTEKMLIDFGRGSWLEKARSQPDKVKQVLQKIKTDGLATTIDAVRAKLDTPIPLGYCNVGVVVESDPATGYRPGDRVVSNGPHAEVVNVPTNLTARVDDSVSDDQAAFVVVAAIALQGIRLITPTLGERIVVSGLGLIGLLAVQLLRAQGCQVLGIDFDRKKLELARQYGAETVNLAAGEDPVQVAEHWTNGEGVDGVLVTASTKSDELMHQAATMCRKRGRIVLIGVVGLNLRRADFYEKELSFQVSCSYGPGRYDANYEQRGLDYPIGFVRWTEQRNFAAILQLLADGRIDIQSLLTHRVPFADALAGYARLGESEVLGVLLDYGVPEGVRSEKLQRQVATSSEHSSVPAKGDLGVAFVGAGGFTIRMLLPNLPQERFRRQTIVSGSGVSAAHAAKKFGFREVSSDFEAVLANDAVDVVFITTPHQLHAKMTMAALRAGKHVFVEKPLALELADVDEIAQIAEEHPNQQLMVGFNRRFSPHMRALKGWLETSPATKSIIVTVNAGAIPADHWTQDLEVGGGRIVGEACHFIDLCQYLVGAAFRSWSASPLGGHDGRLGDCATLQLSFDDGSMATVHYFSNGCRDFPKERIEVFSGGHVFVCDNFRVSREVGGRRKLKTRTQSKGHAEELQEFHRACLEGGTWVIPRSDLFAVSRVSIELATMVRG